MKVKFMNCKTRKVVEVAIWGEEYQKYATSNEWLLTF